MLYDHEINYMSPLVGFKDRPFSGLNCWSFTCVFDASNIGEQWRTIIKGQHFWMLPEVASRRAFFIDAARHLSQRKVEFETVLLGKDVGRRFFCAGHLTKIYKNDGR